MRTTSFNARDYIPAEIQDFLRRRAAETGGLALIGATSAISLALVSWSVADPSLNHAVAGKVRNLLGTPGAVFADLAMQLIGLAAIALLVPLACWGWQLVTNGALAKPVLRVCLWLAGAVAVAGIAAFLPVTGRWPLPSGLGGVLGDALFALSQWLTGGYKPLMFGAGAGFGLVAVLALSAASGLGLEATLNSYRGTGLPDDTAQPKLRPSPAFAASEEEDFAGEPGLALVWAGAAFHAARALGQRVVAFVKQRRLKSRERLEAARAPWARGGAAGWDSGEATAGNAGSSGIAARIEPSFGKGADARTPDMRALPVHNETPSSLHRQDGPPADTAAVQPKPVGIAPEQAAPGAESRVQAVAAAPVQGKRAQREAQRPAKGQDYELPPLAILAEAKKLQVSKVSEDALEQNARLLEGVLDDFGVKGEIIQVRPGPVVTLYELEPAPGIKSSRVIGLADDIARSMSALSARVAVVQGRNAIGIELPNQRRETVYLRELLASESFEKSKASLPIALGKTIGGEAVIVDLARMPHLLVAGTTGSGKSVAINTMILSLLYRLKPEECRLIMVDPKMLELSVYDGIPHLLTPVVTDPKKAVVALKWAVREMEDRYKKMSRVGVRNIDGFNARVAEAAARNEPIMRTVQTGFDKETGEAIYEQEQMDLTSLPFIVVIVDEMADLMMVAGKDIEGAIQRLAQMARAAGIHLIMATQRPSVDVITGTIKANFPTRISFQVTSKIDSRTILGEQGAEQLLGQGDMLYMAGGGRISRVHGPFVADAEVEKIVAHLKTQGQPEYLEGITAEEDAGDADEAGSGPVAAPGSMDAEEAGDLYDRAVNIVLRDRKCSTSYIQRRLSVGYNKAASLVERMEKEGVVGAPNHSGKREILTGGGVDRGAFEPGGDD